VRVRYPLPDKGEEPLMVDVVEESLDVHVHDARQAEAEPPVYRLAGLPR
jgi:hypothetical protein